MMEPQCPESVIIMIVVHLTSFGFSYRFEKYSSSSVLIKNAVLLSISSVVLHLIRALLILVLKLKAWVENWVQWCVVGCVYPCRIRVIRYDGCLRAKARGGNLGTAVYCGLRLPLLYLEPVFRI